MSGNIVLPEDLSGKTDKEIIKSMHGAMFDSDHYRHCVTILQLRINKRLVFSSWALVFSTIALLIGAILPLFCGDK